MTLTRRRMIAGCASLPAALSILPFSMSTLLAEGETDTSQTMSVGAACWDVTGEPGPEMGGFLARKQPSTAIGTRLFARALFLKKNDESLLWLSVDSLGFTQEVVHRVKTTLSEKLGIEPWRVVLSATHTHSAPCSSWTVGEYSEEYVENVLMPGLDQAAMLAKDSVEECFLVEATGESDLNIDRRGAATKHTENRVPALGWKRPDGTFKAVLIGYTMHPVCHCSGLIHAEWPGAVADAIPEFFSSETVPPAQQCVPFVIQGACGNINPGPKVNVNTIPEVGRMLVESVADSLKNAQPVEPYFAVRGRRFAVLLKYDDEATIAAFARRNRRPDPAPEDFMGHTLNRTADRWETWAMNQLHQDGTDYVDADVAAIVLGHRAFVTSPFETLSWMNPELAKHTDIDCFAMGYTNGCYHYLCHDAAYDEGGYEPDGVKLWYRIFPIKRGELERLALNSALLVELTAQKAGLKTSR